MKSLNRNFCLGLSCIITFCLVVTCSLFISISANAAGSKIYQFQLRNYVLNDNIKDKWTDVIVTGNDVDFVSLCRFSSTYLEGQYVRAVYLYAFSFDEFELSRTDHYINSKDERTDSIPYDSGIRTITVNGKTVYYTSYYDSVFVDGYSMGIVSGFPNMHYLYPEDGDVDFIQEMAEEFVANGGLDWEDGPSIEGKYDETLPIIKELTYNVIIPSKCHKTIDNSGCFNLSWKKPEGITKNDYLEIRVLANYNYTTSWSTKITYDSGFYDFSTTYGFIPVYITSSDFCVNEFLPSLNIDSSSFVFLPQKIYLRIIRIKDNNKTYGDWVVYDVKRDRLNIPEIGSGEVIPGNSDFDDMGNSYEPPKDFIDPSGNGTGSFNFDFTDIPSVLGMFKSIIESLISALGTFPLMFSAIFSFLPSPIANAFFLVLIISIIIGILKIFN